MLPIEDRAVRTAQMDTEGHDIGQAIGGAQTAIAALQEAISDVVAFDGEVPVGYDGVHRYISEENLPSTKGLYAAIIGDAKQGLVIYDFISGPNIHVVTVIDPSGTVWKGDTITDGKLVLNDIAVLRTYLNYPSQWDTTPTEDSTKPVTSGGVYAALAGVGGTKWYIHNLVIHETGVSEPINMIVVSAQSNQITLGELRYYNRFVGEVDNAAHTGKVPYMITGYSSYNYNAFGEKNLFNPFSFFTPNDNYMGSTNIECYSADTIDTSTGAMNSRTPTKTILAADITMTDTVTPL